MTRTQLITKVSRQLGIPRSEAETVLNAIVDNITECLQQNENVTIAGFGRFEMRQRKTKNYTNPKTKRTSVLAPTSIPGFKPSGLMKQRIAEGNK